MAVPKSALQGKGRKIGTYPFDDMSTDLILRSCDGVDFHVYKNIMALASPVFQDMLSLPTALSSSHTETPEHPTPVVDMTEKSVVLDHLLRLCYPILPPKVLSLPHIEEVLVAAIKYDMCLPVATLKVSLRDFQDVEPHQVFAVACRLKLDDVAQQAATILRSRMSQLNWKNATSPDDTWESTFNHHAYMDNVSSAGYYRLLSFLRSGAWPKCSTPSASNQLPLRISPSTPSTLSRGFFDLVIQCYDESLPANSLFLSWASPCFADMIKDAVYETDSNNSRRVIQLPEDPTTVRYLIELCNPMGELTLPNLPLSSTYQIFLAALRYNLNGATEFGKRRVMWYATTEPLQVYLIAAHHGWSKEARDAAVAAIRMSAVDSYCSLMEAVDSSLYYALLKFNHHYLQALCKMTRRPEQTFHRREDSKSILRTWTDSRSSSAYSPEALYSLIVDKGLDSYSYYSTQLENQLAQKVHLVLSQVSQMPGTLLKISV